MIWSAFNARGKNAGLNAGAVAAAVILVEWDGDAVTYRPEPPIEGWLSTPGSFGAATELALLLRQLEEEGFVEADGGCAKLAWSDYYKLEDSPEHAGSVGLLGLPARESWRPALSSKGAFTDTGFAVGIQSWLDPHGQRPNGNIEVRGGIISTDGKSAVLPHAAWEMTCAVAEQRARPVDQKTPDANKRDWSNIRRPAVKAGADLTDFLRKTVVLTPDRLRIDLRKGTVPGDMLVEVMPGFDGAPDRWLEMFDRLPVVPEWYEIPDGRGIVHVLLSEEVREVLAEIRRMPGRRVAGDRAEAFVRNPFATLGPAAAKVIDPEQFERAREDAGIVFARFTARVLADGSGHPFAASLVVEEALKGALKAEELKFEGPTAIEEFIKKLESRIAAGAQCCHWRGFDLEILGDSPDQVAKLQDALAEMRRPSKISAADIFDLSQYSDRISGFGLGVNKPYYSPFIAKKSDAGSWFPENIELGLCFTPEGGSETIAVALDDQNLAAVRSELETARAEQRESFVFPGCPRPVPVDWAEAALATLAEARKDVDGGSFPTKPLTKGAIARMGLIVRSNVNEPDYVKLRGSLSTARQDVQLPSVLLHSVQLKAHQLEGLAWLQHLWRHSPLACRGALLADDMGLGKTLQLLLFMAWAIEHEPDLDPFLVVAPLSLLDNWKEEITKFFAPGAMEVLTLYGSSLASKRVPKAALDAGLLQAGAPKLLSPGWLGSAQVVLTTYETLRDLEFSLAAQRWSAMICDEAQKIKNPNALVTRAAWKQHARFKIACTGTPVENTLADLWCLFEIVQPGLLGTLNNFGSKYRRPAEVDPDDEDEKDRLKELRGMIAPQTLRRTKAEVAKDLPRKLEFQGCRALPLSPRQRVLYADALAQYAARDKTQQATGIQSYFGLVQYLRRLSSDPRRPGHLAPAAEPIADIERDSPKMAWMLGRLAYIEQLGEKVIVFCEFLDLQRTLQRAITLRFTVVPDVINGATSADSTNANNRQQRIKAFQEKPGFGVIILSPLAVGFGVNIQAANHVIHFTRCWNPAKEDQATDRAYRIGAQKDVHVYCPVVVAHDFLTFDAKLDLLLESKRALSADMLNGSGDVNPAEFTDLEAPDGSTAFGDEQITSEDVASLGPDAFEAFCALLWSKKGYSRTIRTPKSGDGGVDIVAIQGNEGVLIQCKSSTVEDRELGWEGVKDVAAGAPLYAAQFLGITFAMVAVTNQRFNGNARQKAALLHVELIERVELEALLAKHPIKHRELARCLFSSPATAILPVPSQ